MQSINKVILIGNITHELELKKTATGTSHISFSIATNRAYKDSQGMRKEEVEYNSCSIWGKLADVLYQYSGKGKKVYVEGRLQTRKYEKDGHEVKKTQIVVEKLLLLSSKQENNHQAVSESVNDEEEIKVEDIPF